MKHYSSTNENNAIPTVSLKYPYSGGIGKKLRATLALPLRYLCATLLLLTLGVGQEAKAIGFNQGNIFFDATGWGTTTYMQFAVGHDTWTSSYPINTHVANTNLYRGWASNDGWWSGCNYFAVFSSDHNWDTGSWSYSNISSNAACYSGKYTSAYDINSNNIYVLKPSSSNNGASFEIEYQSSITGLNSTQTVTVQVKTANAANYSNAANCYGTSISAATHYFNSAWDSADQDGAVALSSSTVTGNASAALSSTVSLSLSGTVTTGYQFDGWYYSDGTLISTSTSASYTVRGATIVYARFSEKKFNVTAAKTPSAGGSVTPSSATAMGQITGGSITATPATGYTFTSWAVTSGTGSFVSSTSTASNTYKPTSTSTVTATFTPKTYSITLDKNGGASGGSATATYNSSTLTSVTHASRASYDLTGYYTETSDGDKIINANGTLVASTDYTDASGNWTYDDDVTLYAQWDYNPVTYSVTYGVGTGYTSLGSLAATNTSTSASITSGNSYESGTGITFTATPNTGYTVGGWYTNIGCSSAIGAAGTSNPYAITLSKDTSVYVKFILKTTTITIDNTNSTTGATSVTGTYGSALPAFNAHTRTGYTLNGYYSASSGGTKVINADGTLVASVTISTVPYTNSSSQWVYESSTLTLYPQWTEKLTTVTINASPTGAGTFTLDASAFTAGNTTTAGVTTSHTVVATPHDDYTFSSWATTGNATGTNSTNTYTLKGNGSGSTGMLTANFTLVPCKLWYGDAKFASNSKAGEYTMSYDLTESAYYYDVTTDFAPYCFRFYHNEVEYSCAWGSDGTLEVTANGSKQDAATNVTSYDTHTTLKYNGVSGSQIRIWFDYQNTKTWITTDEEQWALSGGDSGSADGDDDLDDWSPNTNFMTESATNIVSTTVNFTTADTYYLKVTDRFSNSWYGKNSTSITRASNSASGLGTSGDNISLTVDVTGDYTFAYNTSTQTLTVTYPTETGYTVTATASTGGAAGAASYTAYEYTTTAITATPNTGYYFTGWEATSGSVTFADASSASTTINGVTAAATIRANFAPMWVIAGGDSQNGENGDDVMGNWSTSANQIVNIGTNANSKDTGYVEITLPANTNFYFKVKDVSQATNSGWYGNNTSTQFMTYAANNKQPWTFGTDGSNTANCGITTAGAGTYKFAWNMTDKKVTVTFPTSYTVTFGYGTGGSEVTATVEDASAITSGQYAAAGKDITFTQTPATGYTFKGWYTTSDGNTAVTSMGTSDAVYDDIAANINVYAQYTEDMHTVTVTAGEHGSITTPAGGSGSTVSAGIATGAAIVAAVADYGYYFQGWTVESGSATFANASALSTTVYATADATIKANFVSHWTIAGGDSGDPDGADAMGDWSTVANGIDNFEEVNSEWIGYADIDLPANTTFYFKIRDLYDGAAWYGNTGVMTYGNHTNWTMTLNTSNCRITTAGKGTYRFTWNETTKHLTVTYPTSYTVSYSVYTFLGNDESNSESTTGGSISSVVDGDAIALTSGKYVVSGGTAVFTHAAAATNYHFAGWYSDAACETAYVDGEGDAAITDEVLTLTVSGNKTVYAKFAENMTTVNIAHNTHGHVELGGETITSLTAGTVTTRSITAVADAGYYFAGWTVTSGEDYSVSATGEDNTTITVTGGGDGETTGQTLTANFVELDKVYFRNWNADSSEPLWENVYVYFNIYYEKDGESKDCAKSNASSDSIATMTREGSSNVYWAYIPRHTTRSGRSAHIAFSNNNFGNNFKFYGNEAVMRGDYRKGLDMFVPQHGSSFTRNTTTYYNGYWKHHNAAVDSDAGYRIERYTGSGYTTPADNGADRLKFIVKGENTIQYQLRVDNLTDGYNNYMIYSLGEIHYITFDSSPSETGYTITSSNFSNIGLSEYTSGSPRFYITPTSENIYTLTIDMSGDVMRLTVDYPVSVGDHRLKHTYTSGSAKYTYSDVIKSTDATKKLSMYFDNTTSHSPSLKLQKCTALDGNGVPTWGSETSVTMTGVKADTMGVFVFDLAVDGDAGTISNAAPYKGEYYVKADSLPGNWTNYTQNVMICNTNTFDKAKSTTYDYYICHWYGNRNGTYNTNIKCVMANEYNNQLTDTLFGDAVIGVDFQTMPAPGSVRFSYNSTTNELKRTYINGSANWEDRYLLLSGSRKIRRTNGRAFEGNDTTFTDMNNWIYQLDLQAQTNAKVIMTAQFNGQTQYMLGSTNNTDSVQIIGGSTSTWFPMRLVYDFKTDKLIAGYLPGNTTVEETQAINSDVLIIRNGHDNAEQLTFNTGKKLTDVKTVYGVVEFNKSDIQNEGKSRYERNTYWISFPFDVRLDQVSGFGTYGQHWILQYYDGAARAKNGAWIDSPNYWTYVMPAARDTGFVMKAYEGYLISLSLNRMTPDDFWTNDVTTVSLYFPSKAPVETINGELPEAASFVVPEHPCTIERDGRYFKDANWNVIGVPSYANLTKGVKDSITINTNKVPFLYRHNHTTNYMDVADVSSEITFGAMQAYMVQFAGTIDWSSTIPEAVAARRTPAMYEQTLALRITDEQNGTTDRTFIRFSDESTDQLDLNKDLYKVFNGGKADLYSICQDVELGAQLLPLTDETVYVPVGVKAAGTTTVEFALPKGTEGLNVYLFDRQENKHINLLTDTYTVTLGEGKHSDRFVLEISKTQMPTVLMQTSEEDRTVKYMQNGHLYIKQGEMLYNAEGKRVNQVK